VAGNTGGAADAKLAVVNAMRNLPLSFEPAATPGHFLARSGGYTVSIGATESSVAVIGAASGTVSMLRFTLEGANAAAGIEPFEPLPGVTNYYLGSDPGNWRLGVKNFAKLRVASVYPGVDVVYYGDHRRLEFDFIVAPKANPDPIALSFAGMDKLYTASDGDLVAELNGQPVRFAKPYAYQRVAGEIRPVSVDYVLAKAGKVQLQIGEYDKNLELVIDPLLSYASYFGGQQGDTVQGIAVDSNGNAYITGQTCSPTLPGNASILSTGVNCASSTSSFPYAATFVSRINVAGTVDYTQVIAANNGSVISHAIALDNSGGVYIAGTTNANTTLPGNGLPARVTGPGNSYFGGDHDAFIAVLASGTTGTLLRTAYLGGSGDDSGNGIAVDSSGNVIVVGQTCANPNLLKPDFPAYGGFQNQIEACVAFVTKLDNLLHIYIPSSGASYADPPSCGSVGCSVGGATYYFSLFWGGTPSNVPTPPYVWIASTDYAVGDVIVVQAYNGTTNVPVAQRCVVSGKSGTSQPTWTVNAGDEVGDGTPPTAIVWRNVGAPAYATWASTVANGVALDPLGDAYIAGGSDSKFLGCGPPACGGWSYLAGNGAWVLKVNTLGAYQYGTVLGQNSSDSANAIAVDSSGRAYVVGTGVSTGGIFTGNSFQSAPAGGSDAFIVRVGMHGPGPGYGYATSFEYASYLGGSGDDQGLAVAVDGNGAAYVTGSTKSTDFPMVSPLTNQVNNLTMSTLSAQQNVFVTKINSNGSGIPFSTYLGGTNSTDSDYGTAIAVHENATSDNDIYVAGVSNSSDFPVYPSTVFQPVYGNNGDGFVAMILGKTVPNLGGSSGSSSTADFTVSATGVSVAQGSQGNMAVTLTPMFGFNQTVTLTCSVPPPASCAVSPNPVQVGGNNPVTATVTVSVPAAPSGGGSFTPKGSASMRHGHPWQLIMPFSVCGVVLLGRRRRYWLPLLVLSLGLTLSLVGCGSSGGSSSSSTLPPGSYQASVTASYTAGSITHTSTATLTVQ
jgi:hypothetical protein